MFAVGLVAATVASGHQADFAQAQSMAMAPEEVIVRYRASAGADDRLEVRRGVQATLERTLPVAQTQLLELEDGASVSEAVAELERDPDVLYAEPNLRRTINATVNDPGFPQLWGLRNTGQLVRGRGGTPGADISANRAWDITTGSSRVPVAIVDTGVDPFHPDLAPQLWRNPGEIAANGVDDDANGYVDDVRGWDFVGGDNTPTDENDHGTHVAGTVAARGNDGSGVAGVAPTGSVMPLRVLGANGSGFVADAISAYAYAGRNGARIVNGSLGGPMRSQAERDALAAAGNVLFVVAAGNDATDNDVTGAYPCAYDLPNVLCVAASGRDDSLAPFSNYGRTTVDLTAPGVDILSTLPGNRYGFSNGTSMATPHVAGAASLLAARDSSAGPDRIKRALLAGVDPVAALAGRTVSGGRLDAERALVAFSAVGGAASPPALSPAPSPPPAPTSASPTPAPTSAAPAPTAPPATPVTRPAPSLRDGDPPLASLMAPSLQRLSAVRRNGLVVRAGCSEACTVELTLSVSATAARRAGLQTRGTLTLSRAAGSLTRAGQRSVRSRLTSAARRLRPRRALRATVTVRFRDQAGNARTLRSGVTLRP